ncbi:MAG: hypothetical protein Q4C54_05985 [Clostridia bacterium]|nr:hypothetical protein [Clostridia bacterium]
MAYDYDSFKEDILSMTDINLDFYKEKQMKRRINTRMERYGFHSYQAYAHALAADDRQLKSFVDYITINVT